MFVNFRAVALLTLAFVSIPALAVYNQEVIVSGGPELASATISFEASDGQPAQVTTEERDGKRVVYIAFDGNRGKAGTLVITPAGGSAQRYALPAGSGGQPIRIDTRTGRVVADAPSRAPMPSASPGIMLSAYYGYGEVAIESIASAGVTSSADGERPLFETDDNLSTDPYGIQVSFPVTDKFRLNVFYGHYEGDDDQLASSTPTAGGGIDNAIVFQQESPTFGTGIFGGLTPLDSFGKLEIDGDKFGGDLSWPCGRFERVTGTLGIYYQTDDIEQLQIDQFDGVDVGTVRSLEVERDSWIISFGGTYTYPFNDQLGLNLSAGLIGQFYDADMTSIQTVTFFDETEVLQKNDDDDDVALGGYAAIGLTWTLGNFVVSPTALIETGTRSAAVKYPTSGDQVLDGQEVQLDNDNGTNWAFALSLGVKL